MEERKLRKESQRGKKAKVGSQGKKAVKERRKEGSQGRKGGRKPRRDG